MAQIAQLSLRMVRPLAVRRHNEIVQRLRAAGSVSVGELADIFGVRTRRSAAT